MLSGERPFKGLKDVQIVEAVGEGLRPSITLTPGSDYTEAWKVAESCWVGPQTERWAMAEIWEALKEVRGSRTVSADIPEFARSSRPLESANPGEPQSPAVQSFRGSEAVKPASPNAEHFEARQARLKPDRGLPTEKSEEDPPCDNRLKKFFKSVGRALLCRL